MHPPSTADAVFYGDRAAAINGKEARKWKVWRKQARRKCMPGKKSQNDRVSSD